MTNDIFGGRSYKKKPCTSCGELKLYSEFYVKPGRQDVLPSQLSAKDLRDFCVVCFDEKNKNYNRGSRPRPKLGDTLDKFFCDEVK